MEGDKSIYFWKYVTEELLHPVTNIIYDHPWKYMRDDFPTPEEARDSIPNPCGYSTGIEDGMIYGGTMLDAVLCLMEGERERGLDIDKEQAEALLHRVADGMLRTAESAYTPGFLPRSVLPCDGRSHYIDSSRDQYTMFVFGAVRLLRSAYVTEEERFRFSRALCGFADRAIRNVRPENGYDLLRDDDGPTINCQMWGERPAHEWLRLPMIYLAAYSASGDLRYLERYRELRERAYRGSLELTELRGWLYTLQQMQASVEVLKLLETEEDWIEKYCLLAEKIGVLAIAQVPRLERELFQAKNINVPFTPFREIEIREMPHPEWAGLPQYAPRRKDFSEFFLLQDIANVLISASFSEKVPVPDSALDLYRRAYGMLDEAVYCGPVPVHYLAAAVRCGLLQKE